MIAVDFDGTLAQYHGYKGVGVYGPPVLSMLKRVRSWLSTGEQVAIFTSRVSPEHGVHIVEEERAAIKAWLKRHGLPELEITCIKQTKFKEFWDDRAIRVERNVG